MVNGRRAGPPHAAIIAAVVVAAVLLPLLIGDQGETITNLVDVTNDLLGPVALLLLPIALILTIHFLSSSAVAGIFSSSADRNSIHRVSASPVGVVVVLLLVLLLLYNKVSIFRWEDDFE